MDNAKHTPYAEKQYESGVQAQWRVHLADGRCYIVRTFPDSETIFVQSTRFRAVNVGWNTAAEIRTLIAKAIGEQA